MNVSWFNQMPSAATTIMKRTSTRWTRRVRSRAKVNAEKITAPTAKRSDE
jgi:hypothetical protein